MKQIYNKTTREFELPKDEVDLVNQILQKDIITKTLFGKLDRIIKLLEGLQ